MSGGETPTDPSEGCYLVCTENWDMRGHVHDDQLCVVLLMSMVCKLAVVWVPRVSVP